MSKEKKLHPITLITKLTVYRKMMQYWLDELPRIEVYEMLDDDDPEEMLDITLPLDLTYDIDDLELGDVHRELIQERVNMSLDDLAIGLVEDYPEAYLDFYNQLLCEVEEAINLLYLALSEDAYSVHNIEMVCDTYCKMELSFDNNNSAASD